ncbi:MAG: hypothetical protein AAAFM81_12995 [Pseudomonadota bacterium]
MTTTNRAFRDPAAQAAYNEAIARISADDSPEDICADAAELRLSSSRGDRLKAATFYAAAADTIASNNPHDACFWFHYSGQAFRSVEMAGKASEVYLASLDAGNQARRQHIDQGDLAEAKSVQRFAIRSAARAAAELRSAGRLPEAADAWRAYHDAEQALFTLDDDWRTNIYAGWKTAFDYHLSWNYAAAVVLIGLGLSFALPGFLAKLALLTATVTPVITAIRRF